jgi:hypothetical protein
MLKEREIDKLRLLSSTVKHNRIYVRRTYGNEQLRRIDGIGLWSHVVEITVSSSESRRLCSGRLRPGSASARWHPSSNKRTERLSYLILVLTERGSQILSSASTKNNSPELWGILNGTSLNLSITHRLGTSNMGKSEQGKRNNAAAGGLPYSRVKSTNVFK